MTANKPIISLFSGAMGLDLGLEAAGSGLRTVVALELNHFAVETIQLNRPNLSVINRPIQKVKTEEILKQAGLKVGEAFLVTGGPCCQSFSTAGKRESLGDKDRGGLFRHFKRVVRETQPRFFVMENVKGILSAAVRHRPLNKRGPGWPPLSHDEELGSALRIIRRELANLGYYVIFGLLNCADYGVPQKRYRVVFIGSRDGELIELPKPTHAESANGKPQWLTLRHALEDLKEKKPEFIEFSPVRLGFLKQLRAGQNWTDLPKKLQRKALGAAYISWGGRCGFCRRLAWAAPSPTLTTAPGTALREEAARLKIPIEVPKNDETFAALAERVQNEKILLALPAWNSHAGEVTNSLAVELLMDGKATLHKLWPKKIEFECVMRVKNSRKIKTIISVDVAEAQCSAFIKRLKAQFINGGSTTKSYERFEQDHNIDATLCVPGRGNPPIRKLYMCW